MTNIIKIGKNQMIEINTILLVAGIVLLLGVILSKVSSYVGVPTLVVFLLIGLVFNSNYTFIAPSLEIYEYIKYISIFALIIIIFSGGLDTNTSKVKPIIRKSVVLSILGTFITAISTGLLIHYILEFNFILSFLIGSIISSTDAAAIFSIFSSVKRN
jgi:cell volume regulation protein A